jgi:DNA-binding transcriptional regulator YbjK
MRKALKINELTFGHLKKNYYLWIYKNNPKLNSKMKEKMKKLDEVLKSKIAKLSNEALKAQVEMAAAMIEVAPTEFNNEFYMEVLCEAGKRGIAVK